MKEEQDEKEAPCEVMTEEQIDQSLAESFPASDPPPWTLGIEDQCEPGQTNEVATEAARSASQKQT